MLWVQPPEMQSSRVLSFSRSENVSPYSNFPKIPFESDLYFSTYSAEKKGDAVFVRLRNVDSRQL